MVLASSLRYITIQTDASRSWGVLSSSTANGSNCNGTQNGHLWQRAGPNCYISCAVLSGAPSSRKLVLFKCDNTGVVAAVKKGSAREPLSDALIVHLVAYFHISINIEHIAGIHNGVAGTLSRGYIQQFFLLHPQADHLPRTPTASTALRKNSVSCSALLWQGLVSGLHSEVLSDWPKTLLNLLQRDTEANLTQTPYC